MPMLIKYPNTCDYSKHAFVFSLSGLCMKKGTDFLQRQTCNPNHDRFSTMNERAQSSKRKDHHHHHHHSQHHNYRLPQKQKLLLLRHGHGGDASIQQQLQKGVVKEILASPSSSTSSPSAVAATGDAMRDPCNRTKVVVRRLPPSLSQTVFMEHIQSRFAGMFNWISFCPGKLSIKGGSYARAYIDFKHPEDVFEFHDGFDGHIFVNEKGTQYKAMIEYAPHQGVPKLWSKEDMREGSILKDREYLDFLEVLAKPIDFLPSAEVQLERKEAERSSSLAAGAKEGIIVTPLMEYVRKKRASKSQRLLVATGKLSARRGSLSSATSSMSSKRGVDRSRANTMYAPVSAAAKPNKKLAYVARREENHHQEFSLDTRRGSLEPRDEKLIKEPGFSTVGLDNQNVGASEHSGTDMVVEQPSSHGRPTIKKGVLGKEKEEPFNGPVPGSSGLIGDSFGGSHSPKNRVMPSRSTTGSGSSPQGLMSPGGGRNGRVASFPGRGSLLLQQQQSDQDKRSSRSYNRKFSAKDPNAETNRAGVESQDGRRLRNRDRPDRPVWTVRRRADGLMSLDSTVSPPHEIAVVEGFDETESQMKNSSQHMNGIKVGLDVGGHALGDSGQLINFNLIVGPESGSNVNPTVFRVLQGNSSQHRTFCQMDGRNEVVLLSRSAKAQGTSKSMNLGNENGDAILAMLDKERHKQEALACWNEFGGSQRQMRRDYTLQYASKEYDDSIAVDASRAPKRGGGLSMSGGHEKQVWVAKSETGS